VSAAYACDGPNCAQFVRADEDDDKWIELTWGRYVSGHFCSLNCLRDWEYEQRVEAG
jgi:hypothetical protein